MISVFTPTHRNIYLRQAYESLKAQTYTDWEWVILANGGVTVPDFDDPRVKVFHTNETGMVGVLKKMACDLCTGDYLVEFDHDDELTPDCLEEISKCTEDFVYSNCFQVNNEWGTYYWGEAFGWEWRNHVYEPKNLILAEAVSPEPFPSNLGRIWFAPNHVRAWKRSFYERIGGHAAMKISDDHDLVSRSYLEGTIKHIDKPLYIYRVHGENTWLQVTQEIQDTMWANYDKYFMLMQEKWSRDNDLRLVDLGGAIDSPEGYERYDRHNADIVGDLNDDWNLEDNSVGLLRAHDIVEHLKNPIHTMNEAWRVLPHGGVLDILVPSTDGVGAWCDPTHVSYWNIRSFRYYTEAAMRRYIEPECVCRFMVVKLENITYDNIPYVQAHLLALKDGFRYHGELLI